MLLRLSIISMLLITQCSFAMEHVYGQQSVVDFELQEREPETTGVTNRISSLQSWRAVAKDYDTIDGFDVLPEAVAEFQQKYEIKTDLPVAPWVPQLWAELKYSANHPGKYDAEVRRMHAWLRGGDDTRDNAKLADKKDAMIKKAYNLLNDIENKKADYDEKIACGRRCRWRVLIMTGILVSILIAELVYFVAPRTLHNVNTTAS